MRTMVGLVEIVAVDRAELDRITEQDALRTGEVSLDALVDGLRPWLHKGPLYRVQLRWAGEDPRIELRNRDSLTDDEIATLTTRMARMDRLGPWTTETLRAIASAPGTRAGDLAARLGRETLPFKRDVRKLKELGLTESLEVGYRLSPRGVALLATLDAGRPE